MNQTPSSNWLAFEQPFLYTLQGTPEDVSQALVTLNEEGGCLNGYLQSVQLEDARAGYYFTFTIRRRNRIFYITAQAEGRITGNESGEVTVEGHARVSSESLLAVWGVMVVTAIIISISAKVPLAPTLLITGMAAAFWTALFYYDRSTALAGIENAMSLVRDFSQIRKNSEALKIRAGEYWKGVKEKRSG